MAFWLTHSGQKIDLDSLSLDIFNLDDIAHHLTKLCRYSGGLELHHYWSVARHSITMCYYAISKKFDKEVQRYALMHDATEAYLGDVNGVLKKYLPDYLEWEAKFDAMITEKYKLSTDPKVRDLVSQIDKAILLDEGKIFHKKHYSAFCEQYKSRHPLGVNIYSEQDLAETKAIFLHCCEQLDIYD